MLGAAFHSWKIFGELSYLDFHIPANIPLKLPGKMLNKTRRTKDILLFLNLLDKFSTKF